MAALNPRMMLALSEVPEEAWGSLSYKGYAEGLWDEDAIAAFEALDTKAKRRAVKGLGSSPPTPSPENPRTRRKRQTRNERLKNRRFVPGLRYVRRCSLDPFLDARLSKGACRTLIYLIARCGRSKTFSAPTCWVAEDLALTTRSVQSHYAALEQAGYILRSSPDRRGRTTVRICAAAEPPPFRKQTPANDALSAAESAKISSPTQAMKARISDVDVEPLPETANLDLGSRETGSELARPAQPPSPATGGGDAHRPLRISEESWLTRFASQAAEGQQAEPSAFDAKMAAILSGVLNHMRSPVGTDGRDDASLRQGTARRPSATG